MLVLIHTYGILLKAFPLAMGDKQKDHGQEIFEACQEAGLYSIVVCVVRFTVCRVKVCVVCHSVGSICV